jgi:hypothetical protein
MFCLQWRAEIFEKIQACRSGRIATNVDFVIWKGDLENTPPWNYGVFVQTHLF